MGALIGSLRVFTLAGSIFQRHRTRAMLRSDSPPLPRQLFGRAVFPFPPSLFALSAGFLATLGRAQHGLFCPAGGSSLPFRRDFLGLRGLGLGMSRPGFGARSVLRIYPLFFPALDNRLVAIFPCPSKFVSFQSFFRPRLWSPFEFFRLLFPYHLSRPNRDVARYHELPVTDLVFFLLFTQM